MDDQPKTGAEAVMRPSMEQSRIEVRDRAVALAVAREMIDRYFKPESIEGIRDARDQMERAVEHAAYEAIQRERENHKGDMKLLEHFAQMRLDILASGTSITRIDPKEFYHTPEEEAKP